MKISIDDRYRQRDDDTKWVGETVPEEHWNDAIGLANAARRELLRWGVGEYIEVLQVRFVPNVLKKLELKLSHVIKMETPSVKANFDTFVEFHFGKDRKDEALRQYLREARTFFLELTINLQQAASNFTVQA
jgi:hypothetical protein